MTRAAILLLALAGTLHARPPYKKALLDLLGLPASSRLNDCKTCHLPGKDDERPHNAFGARLKALRAEHKKAGKPLDVETRLLAIADEDSDGDGVTDLIELLAGTSPGDPADRPSDTQVADAKVRKTALLASLGGYRWRPFARVESPAVPAAIGRAPIDAFLQEQHVKRGIVPQGEATRPVLLRRVTLDLTGLPPTVEELEAFLNDASPTAYERVVDRLLASPAFGERWGRHWMDVWRYSDWAGFGTQVRDSQPHIWHWRDWIVESLNENKSYARMAEEMLAADELAPLDDKALRATGYLVRNYKLLSREKWLQDTVDHAAMGFLGVTMGCARCHDHMYEAVTQKEYYRLRAVFTPHNVRTDRLPGFPDTKVNGLPRAYDADPGAKTFLYERGDDRLPGKEDMPPGVPELLGGRLDVKPVPLARQAINPGRRPFVIAELIASVESALAATDGLVARSRRRETLAALAGGLTRDPLTALAAVPWKTKFREAYEAERLAAAADLDRLRCLAEVEALEDAGRDVKEPARRLVALERRVAALQARSRLAALRVPLGLSPKIPQAKQLADAEKVLAATEAAIKAPLTEKYTPRPATAYPATSTGRRLAFARWLTSRDNPLAARVAVNHVWARHFGAGLVPGMFDFGKNAPPATHPALVDWLAADFMESGWDLKRLHRRLVTSAAYRADSRPTAANLAKDADNVWLWRYAPRRIEAEAVRDLILAAGGRLDRAMGGPEAPESQALNVTRRSVYLRHAQEKQADFLLLFDCASVTEAYQRKQAVMPQQALALLNSEFALANARQGAALIEAKDDGAFVRAAFLRLLTRVPTADEAAECVAFLKAQGRRLTPARARGNMMHALLNHHEFVTAR